MVGFPAMRQTRLVLWIASCLLLVGLPARALEFTADQVTKIDGKSHKANIYYRDQMWRIEHHSMGPVNVSIVRKDKQVVWLLLSRMKHFKTMPYRGIRRSCTKSPRSKESASRCTISGSPRIFIFR
jgi:hypothetical protein